MHIILDRRRLARVFPVVRNRGSAAKKAPFLRLDAHQGELTISGLAVEAGIPALVEEPGVLFIRATLLRSLLDGFAGKRSLVCRVTEEAFMLGNVRLPLTPESLVYFPDRAKAPRTLPGTERLEVRYGDVVETRRNKGAKAGARARKDKDKAAMPLFDRETTQGFELRPPSRAVTRRMEFASARKAKAAPPPASAPAAVAVIGLGDPIVVAFAPNLSRCFRETAMVLGGVGGFGVAVAVLWFYCRLSRRVQAKPQSKNGSPQNVPESSTPQPVSSQAKAQEPGNESDIPVPPIDLT